MARATRFLCISGLVLPMLAACGSSDKPVVIIEPPIDAPNTWNATVATPGLPAEAAARVAVPNRGDFTVTGFNATTGQVQWTRRLPDGTNDFGSFGDLFIAYRGNAADSSVATLIDPVNGFDIWTLKFSSLQPVFVLRVNETIIASINDTLLVGLDRRSGQQAWRTRLGPLTCTTQTFCGRLRGIGVDRGDAYLLRQSSVEAQVITVRETGIVSQVVASRAVLRRVIPSEQLTAIVGTGGVGVQSVGEAAAIDAASGAERWRTAFSTLVPATYSPTPSVPRFTSDGAYLLAPLADSTTAREVILDMKTGQQTRQRAITRTQFSKQKSECGADGYAYLRDDGEGFDYVNARTGTVTPVTRAGLSATLTTAGLANAFPTTSGYIVFSAPFTTTTRQFGVKCTP